MKKVLGVLALQLMTLLVFAQKHEFYKLPKGQLVPPSKVDSVMESSKEQLKKLGMEHMTPTMDVVREFTSGDTLYKVVRFGAKSKSVESKRHSLIGKKPEFALNDIDGNPISTELLKGKPYVLNLWFTACPPCIAEIPGLNKMKAAFPDVALIAMTYNTKEEVRDFIKGRPFDFLQITDAKAVVDQWQVGYPTTLFIDKEGTIQHVLIGASLNGLDEKEFMSGLQKIM